MNCLYIETPFERILIETGIGEKWSDRDTAIYGIYRERPFAETLHEKTGLTTDDISIVVNTHLHFDHAGGNTVINEDGAAVPQFRNARYLVSRSEFEHAAKPHERDRASYLADNWEPVMRSGQLELMPEEYDVADGIRMEQVRGHSETMQTLRIDRGGETLVGFFDMIPTRHHLPLPWIMSYDLYPTETLEYKRNTLPRAVDENWICHFYHDVEMPLGRLVEKDGKIIANAEVVTG
jgi:glyoxylase-like metal-dependent hydrolase (beta-lactamase superfamily II)